MCETFIRLNDIKNNLLERWDEVFLNENGQELLNEYKELNQLGFFSKGRKISQFVKKLTPESREVIDKNNLSNELAYLVTYQQLREDAYALLDKYVNDLEYLYYGDTTNWEDITNTANEMIDKCRNIDTALNSSEYRIKFAADPKITASANDVLLFFSTLESTKKEAYNFLDITEPINSDNYLRSDVELIKLIQNNPDDVYKLIPFNNSCKKTREIGLDYIVDDLLDGKVSNVLGISEQYYYLDYVNKYKQIKKEINNRRQYIEDLGPLYKGNGTDWEFIRGLADETEKKIKDIDQKDIYAEKRKKYAGDESIKADSEILLQSFKDYKIAKEEAYSIAGISINNETQNWFEEEIQLCSNVIDNIDQLRDWATYKMVSSEVRDKNMGAVVNAYEAGMDHNELLPAYKKTYYRQLSDLIISRSQTLSLFSGKLFEEKINQYRELDRKVHEVNQKIIFNTLVKQIPDFTSEASRSSEISILERAIRSRGRGQSLRRIFEKAPNVLMRICPCMLMSPISVAQYFDPKQDFFDLVVFDEASQLQTCKAVGAISRGKNAIIVGDRNQMPPTTFFMANTDNEENADINDLESILDDCTAMSMPTTKLLWHYRSDHESLIAFSNSEFYDNKLYTFPSVNDRESKVKFVRVDGVFEHGRKRINRKEAEEIVNELKRRCRDKKVSDLSVGVVTFNINQQTLIEDLIAQECEKDAVFDKWIDDGQEEPVFVKNLENIQGDERDVILFSICYGPDETGKVSMNFGPLNREGGGRRLNVAVSRARKEMIIYSSLISDQIDLNRTKSKGVMEFKAFLEYAQSGRLPLNNNNFNADTYATEGIIDSIISELESSGFKCDKMIGHSEFRVDLGVIDPNNPDRYLLGILLDGPNYQLANTTHDREIAKVSILQNLGWQVYRIWSMDWWHQKDKYLKEIKDILDELIKNSEKKVADIIDQPKATKESIDLPTLKEKKVEIVKQEQVEKSDSRKLEKKEIKSITIIKEEYRKALKPSPFFGNLNSTKSIVESAEEIIKTEAPITLGYLKKRLFEWYPCSQSQKNRLSIEIQDVLLNSNLNKIKENRVYVFWRKKDDPDQWLIWREAGSLYTYRTPTEIPEKEKINALCYTLKDGRFLDKFTLIQETSTNLLGAGYNIQRKEALNKLLIECLDVAIEKGWIIKYGSTTYALGKLK